MVTGSRAFDPRKNVKQEYPLTPMQEGMLFHRLWAPGSGVDMEQIVCTLREPLDVLRFVEAFDHVIDQHAVLRTKFEWIGRERPAQVVEPSVQIPFLEVDASSLSSDAWDARLAELLRTDRNIDFDMQRAPLMRLTFVKRSANEFVCIWTFHHILLDGRSFPLVLGDVFDAYDARLRGVAPATRESRPFADFIAFKDQAEQRDSEQYYRELLKDFTAPTPLEVSFANRTKLNLEQRSVSVRLTRESTERVERAARTHGVTPNTLFQAAWGMLLSRYSSVNDVVFGTTRACRNPALEGSRDIVGLLINTVPFRMRFAAEQTVEQLLKSVRERQIEARPYERMSLAEIQKLSQVPTGSALFESIAVFDNATLDQLMKQRGARFERTDFDYLGQTNFPLTLAGYLDPELLVRLEFDPARFDAGTAGRMVRHFVQLLENLGAAAPGTLARDVPMLRAEERQQLIEGWNLTDGPFPDTLRMHDPFELQAKKAPDATALVCQGQTLSYGELDRRANRLAQYLVSQGVKRGSRVGLCLDRSFDLIVSMFAVLKAGGTYVPLDPAYPEDRLRFMLEDTAAALVLAHTHLTSRLPQDVCRLVALDHERAAVDAHPDSAPPCPSEPDDLAYIIYTSGSTGRPKGVIVRHKPALNLIDWVNGTYQVGPSDRLLFVTSVCFDLSVYDVFGMLAAGGSLHIATAEDLKEPRALIAILRSRTITFWDSAPAALSQLVPFFPERDDENPLRLVFLSGDWIPVPLPDRIRGAFPKAQVISLGGATEATIWSNFFPIGEVDARWPSIPYGRPIRNARYYVLDDRLEPLPVGAPGQLHIGGLCLADGYHNRPDLNAEKFIDSPFLPGTKLYRTGDLSRFMPDGNLEFLGRLDLQVKVRGYRIELGEIEAVINGHANVLTSLLDAPRSAGSERVLVAYVVPDGKAPDANELRALCQQKLPDYMVPAHFMMLDALPMTPNGKVDRKALPTPTSQATAEYVAPRNEIERALAEIMGHCLNAPRVGVFDNFFELGGHSLLAVRVISEVGLRLAREIPLGKFLSQPTVAGLAQLVEATELTAKRAPEPVARAKPGERPVPSFAQERLIFIQRLDPESAAYNISFGFDLFGAIDVQAMKRALEAIMHRHEPLRTAFEDVAGTQWARIMEPELPFVAEDLTKLPVSEREAALAQILKGQSAKPFKLEHAPLFRAALVRVGERRSVLSLVVHHVVFDGWSTNVLLDELSTLYSAFAEGKPDPLCPPSIRFNDYVAAQRRDAAGQDWEGDLDYWRERLKGPLPLLQLPIDRTRPRTLSYRGSVLPWRLSPEASVALRRVALQHEATVFNTLIGAFGALLHRYSGQNDILLGIPSSSRDTPELHSLIGLFLNTLVVRLQVEGQESFARLLGQTKARCLEALDHRNVPFEKLVEDLNPPRDTSTTPIFQAFFSYQETSSRVVKNPHFELSSLVLDQGFSRTDVSLFVEDSKEAGISGYFEYSTDLFDRDTISALADGMTALVEDVIGDADAPVARLSVMSPGERARQLSHPNQTQATFDTAQSAIHRFEREAERHPERLAVVHGNTQLSYGQLLSEVRGMATRLRAAGAGPGRGVALFLERGPRLLVTMLASHRLGAHYIPLDPGHPAERNGRVIRLSAPAVVVTEQAAQASLPPVGEARLIDLDHVASVVQDAQPIAAQPDGLAYIIFTSGSTGDPKGVEIPQRALTNFLCSMAVRPGMTASDHLVSITTISFDIAELELLLPMVTGASVDILDRASAMDPHVLGARLAQRPATIFQATPATYRMLLDGGWLGQKGLKVLCGGEALPRDLAELLVPKVGSLWNMYGPTETTIWSSLEEVRLDEPTISIGKPIHNTELYVLNEALEPVPRGVTGMLYIAGDGVALGYHGRPDLTDAAFVRDPFDPREGARFYRTGDLARRLRDGRLECLGRNDFQVKIRGYRIELGEIELVLANHAGVKQVVVDVDRSAGEPRLVAYVVASEQDLAAERLVEHARAHLPSYMVPSLVVQIDSLPLTANGKVDRKALRAGNAMPLTQTSHTAPRDDLELRVCAVFEHLLGVSSPSIDESFFDLGGHSLLAVRLARELGAEFGMEISIGTIFERPSVAALSEIIRAGGGKAHASVLSLNRGRPGVTPMYFICGIHLYRPLARALGEHQPCYGIFLPEEQQFFEEHNDQSSSVEELARMYVQSMRSQTPHGPYMLAGVSFGGLLAFEMARQLRAQGEDVPLLVLLDAVLPSAITRSTRDWLKFQMDELKRTGLRGIRARAERKLRERFAPPPAEPGECDFDRLRRAAYSAAAVAYELTPRTYDGATVLIRASESDLVGVTVDPELGWGPKLAGDFKVYQSVGDHLGVLRESLTAEILRRELGTLSGEMGRGSLVPMMAPLVD